MARQIKLMMPFFIGAFSSFRAKRGGAFGLLLLILLTGCDVVAPDDQYQLGPDSEIQLEVPRGAVRELTLPPSKVYPGYTHSAWLYIPAHGCPVIN